MSHRSSRISLLSLAFMVAWGCAVYAEGNSEHNGQRQTGHSASGARPPATAGENSLFVSCWRLPVHSGPSAFSPTQGMLTFGNPVAVVDGDGAGRCDKKLPKTGWVHIRAAEMDGYVPVNTLASGRVIDRQDPSRALRKAGGDDAGSAGKGFSEEEDTDDLAAMKGAGGEASLGSADFGAIDRILGSPAEYNPAQAYAQFRKDGQTGEFSAMATSETKEERQ